MIEQMRRELASLLPLEISAASYSEPTLMLAGEGWSFSSASAWRITRGGILEYGWSSPESNVAIQRLRGKSIVAIAPQSAFMAGDPAFEFSDGGWLEVFSDYPTDPWSLQLPNITFVGSPSDPSQVQ